VTAAAASPLSAAVGNSYTVTPLVSDVQGAAPHFDPLLKNAWGLTAGPTTPWWVADNATDVSTLYTADGTPFPPPPAQRLVVAVDGGPTGAVFNPTGSFPVGGSPARFLFVSEDGKIRGWNGGPAAQVVVDNSGHDAIYKGLAVATSPSGPRLYATDFHNAGVDVFDGSFAPVTTPGAFIDPAIPTGFAPFGIQAVGNRIFVSYAKQDENAEDDVAGQALGFVDAYGTDGTLLARVAQHGQLNAPWGLALAPASFGRFGGDLLVGNFGDGRINAYEELPSGQFVHRGQLRTGDGKPVDIDGLWALQFGHGDPKNGPRDTLFFTAGPNDEADGLFGTITAG
jgi:uncharacterized protein (TIGR03118 family)